MSPRAAGTAPFRPTTFKARAAKAATKDRRTGRARTAWEVRMEVDGRSKRRRFDTAAERDAWLGRLQHGWAAGLLFDPAMRQFVSAEDVPVEVVGMWQVVVEHLEAAAPGWQPRTLQSNCSSLAAFLIDVCGVVDIPRPQLAARLGAVSSGATVEPFDAGAVGEVSAADVQRWLAGMVRDGRVAMAKRSRAVVKPMFALAVERGHVESTPFAGVKLYAPAEDDELDADLVLASHEVLDLWEEVEAYEPEWAPIVLLCGLCGLRPGEAAVVRRCDLDLPVAGTGWVTVGATSTSGIAEHWRGGPQPDDRRGPLKHRPASARRTAPIPSFAVPLLRAHLDEHVASGPEAPVLPSADLSNFRGRWRALMAERYSTRGLRGDARTRSRRLQQLRLHDLRHAAATAWLNARCAVTDGLALGRVEVPGGVPRHLRRRHG